MTLRTKLIDDSRRAHANWFSCFSQSEFALLSSIGITCGAENNFFKHEILNIFDALQNRKLKQISHLYNQFVNRYLDLVPEHIRIQADKKLLVEDQNYCAWFFNRQMFIFEFLVAKDNFTNGKKRFSHLLWSPLLDIHSPSSCYKFKNAVFQVTDDEFQKLAAQHWGEPQKGCRCCLISITAEKAENYIKSSGGLDGKELYQLQ